MKLGVLVYLERDEQVLMIHRQKKDEHQNLWLAPGGKVEANEAPHEAAVRETYEETGLTTESLELKAVLTFPDDGTSPFGDEWTVFVFYGNRFSGELRADCPEGMLQWVPRSQLLDLPMWEGDELFTPKVFEPGIFTGKLAYHHDTLKTCVFWENADA